MTPHNVDPDEDVKDLSTGDWAFISDSKKLKLQLDCALWVMYGINGNDCALWVISLGTLAFLCITP